MKHSILCAIYLVAITVTTVSAQLQRVAGVVNIEHKFKSEVLGEERTVLVNVPLDYDVKSPAKYPVVYMLDAGVAQMAMMVGILEQQSASGQIPPMILVGITNENGKRNYDLTPTDNKLGGERGGGEKFMQFIEKELVPLIDKSYHTAPYRIFAGHSFGGLMVCYSFATRPDLFDAYISSSAALHWDERLVVRQTAELFKQKREFKKTMFMAIANEPGFLGDANAFRDMLKKANPPGFEFEFREYKDETHGSGALLHYYAGLRRIFAGWLAPEEPKFFEDVESHYNGLTKRFGFSVPIPERKFAQFAAQFAQANLFDDAIRVLKKDVATYPDSAGAHQALAIVYERNNQIRFAKDEYEKAWKLAESQKDLEIAKTSKAGFDRLSTKLN